jgi:hypothetical protein
MASPREEGYAIGNSSFGQAEVMVAEKASQGVGKGARRGVLSRTGDLGYRLTKMLVSLVGRLRDRLPSRRSPT